ncbi:MAG: MBOAT family protein, partial [Phaeodactylibacter sp.]|nr:MBOAT family protein [Phaeodactylibacter sp.]
MTFNSSAFLILLILTFALYWAVGQGRARRQNLILLLASCAFYAWWDLRFLSLLFLSAITDFWVSRQLPTAKGSSKKAWLALSLCVNLGVLFTFKYFDFFIESLGLILPIDASSFSMRVVLPVGISFYTFQTLGYTLDVYRGRIPPTNKALQFLVFVAFFPQLVAGPIERAGDLLPQFGKARTFQEAQSTAGLQLMLWGFFKKMVIADNLGHLVDVIYADPGTYGALGVVVGTVAFAFQIYADFSGYSDIAIGTAMLFGIRLHQNFRTPYQATSFRDFWQRWHISLSSWFRDYVYIPLGGNRVPVGHWLMNLMLTFLLSGLWHGASFNFLFWGGLHGLVLCVEALFRKHGWFSWHLPVFVHQLKVFVVVCLCWLFFRASTIEDAWSMLCGVFAWPFFGDLSGSTWLL